MKKIITLVFLMAAVTLSGAPRQYGLQSPDGSLELEVSVSDAIMYNLSFNGKSLISGSRVSMCLDDGTVYGISSGKAACMTRTVDQKIRAQFYKKAEIRDNFNEMSLRFKDFDLVFRVYDDGMAYRFISRSKVPFNVVSEQAEFSFPEDWPVYVPYVKQFDGEFPESQFFNSFENTYEHTSMSGWDSRRLAFLPLLVEGPDGCKICITESDLQNYPGMYLHNPDGGTSLSGVFAGVPDKVEQGGHNMLQGLVKSRKPYIAECQAGEAFPWRIVIISARDSELADNDMVYRLGEPAQEGVDFSWVRPGKVAWDWWNDWNIYGVDFKSGINNDTYKYYIDFASSHGIEYVILDEGWAVNMKADLFAVVPEIDLEMLLDYAESKNVGIILWAGYWAFHKDLDEVCRRYSEMGVKGFKVDFMDRDDQEMVAFIRRAAETAARYGLMLDFHGTYKPAGLNRTWPNIVNYEGVHGLEQMKWSPRDVDQVTYDVTIPFIRMVAGPMDYTQGAMRNAARSNYYPVYNEPMSQGTRCRQLAEYVVFESPLNMLCDSPSNYMSEPECTGFISSVPETWDETVAVDGKVAGYVVIARRKGDVWYVGAMTDWSARTLDVDLSFLGDGNFSMEIYRDGVNADKVGKDYVREVSAVPADRRIKVSMAPGGGFAARITVGK